MAVNLQRLPNKLVTKVYHGLRSDECCDNNLNDKTNDKIETKLMFFFFFWQQLLFHEGCDFYYSVH